jgi:hypothetical protein
LIRQRRSEQEGLNEAKKVMTIEEIRGKCIGEFRESGERIRALVAEKKDRETKMALLQVLDEVSLEINEIRECILSS